MAERALTRLADDGEGLGEDVVERLAVLEPRRNSSVFAAELVVGELLISGSRCDVLAPARACLQAPALADAQDLLEGAVVAAASSSRVPAAR